MRRLKLLKALGRVILPEYKFQYSQISWWHDEHFAEYLRAFAEDGGFESGRRWTVYQLARLVSGVSGDTAECGVYKGASSCLICTATADRERIHHAFDSFEGLSAPDAYDGGHWQGGDLATPMEIAQRNLSRFQNVSWHKGWIPDRFKDVSDRSFAFVHIDVDLYQPTRDSIDFFYPRTNPGGIIVCDDYAFTTCPGASKAVDEYLADKPEKMICLPCGGGFIIKGTTTGATQQTTF